MSHLLCPGRREGLTSSLRQWLVAGQGSGGPAGVWDQRRLTTLEKAHFPRASQNPLLGGRGPSMRWREGMSRAGVPWRAISTWVPRLCSAGSVGSGIPGKGPSDQACPQKRTHVDQTDRSPGPRGDEAPLISKLGGMLGSEESYD